MILFLDFDGVTHSTAPGTLPFEPRCLAALAAALADYPEVRIVVSSSWREAHGLEVLRDCLGPLAERVIGATPVLGPGVHARYAECRQYLEQHGLRDSAWVALDDHAESFPPDAPVIVTQGHAGFTEQEGQALRERLFRLMSQTG